MSYPPPSRRVFVIKAKRETLALTASACGLALALAYTVHSRPAPATDALPIQQDWTGQLANVAPLEAAPKAAESLTSASLVVPKSQLALPSKPKAIAKAAAKATCADESCAKGTTARLTGASADQTVRLPAKALEKTKLAATNTATSKPDLMTRLNPLNHIPDVVRQPFTYAGDAVSGWIKRF